VARGDGCGARPRSAPGRSPGPPRCAPGGRAGRDLFLAATARHPTLLVTGIVDLDANRLIDVLPARSATAVTGWLASKPAPWLAGIDHVVIELHQPYATAEAKRLPAARLVVDHFHVIRLANAAVDEIRRRT